MGKKVLVQINTVVNSGSTGRIAEEIGKLAIEKGWESYIAYGRGNRPSASRKIRIGNLASILIHVLITRFFDAHGMGSILSTLLFVQKLKRIKPDLIHLHNVHGYYLNIPILFRYLKKAQLPVIWTLHDCWPFTGHCVYFEKCGCHKWKTGCGMCCQSATYPAVFLFDNSRRNWKWKRKLFLDNDNITLVPVSDWLSSLIDYSFLSRFDKRVIKNGVDVDIFKSNISSTTKKKIILGVASVWEPRKGFEDFIKLWNIISHDKYEILLVGLSDELMEKLPEEIVGIKRTESIHELAEYYSSAFVFVNPTYEDNFPTTNLEALSCGTPVISYRTGGSPEAFDSETGFTVEKGNVQEIKAAIDLLSKEDYKKISYRCRKRVLEEFSDKECFLKYINLYDEKIKTEREK